MTTLETIQEILNENLDIDPTTVAADSTFESLGIDSLDMVELVCEIENRFDIELGEAEGLDTVGKLVDYIDGMK
ncbi:acyl carrier protein [Slackia isoflavoniconvertens]|uniref:acyl carrier protein n=1 Tax=Slackia isoflavoniconvertens TaxID=572010 RepID=UPI002E765E7C|nr:acyl carrier protein [Slackia isoflavoniconvertens]